MLPDNRVLSPKLNDDVRVGQYRTKRSLGAWVMVALPALPQCFRAHVPSSQHVVAIQERWRSRGGRRRIGSNTDTRPHPLGPHQVEMAQQLHHQIELALVGHRQQDLLLEGVG